MIAKSLIAQEYIPYRKGKLWGVSDEKAKIVIRPQYDSIIIVYSPSSNVFETFKNKKKGYIINNKEIVPAKYDRINSVGGNLLFASNRTNENITAIDFYDVDGKKLLKTPAYFVEQYDLSRDFRYSVSDADHRELIKFTDEKQKESVFIWNSNQQKIEMWILKDIHSIVLNPKNSPLGKILIHYKKSENSPLEDVYYTIENNKFIKTEKTAKQFEIDYNYLERGHNVESDIEEYSYRTGSGEGRGYDSEVVVMDNSPRKPNRDASQKTASKTIRYSEKDGKIFIGNYAGTQAKEIKMSFYPEKTDLKSSTIRFTEQDTAYHYTNYIIYKYNGKSGFFYKEPYNRSIEYDTLIWKPGISSRDYANPKPYIVAGNKKDGNFRYGVIDIDHKVILPVEYEEINPCRFAFSFWITQKNEKFQIFPTNDEDSEWLSKEYDLIEQINDFLLFKKDGKYGIIYKENALKDKLSESEALFDYRIRKVSYNFYKEGEESKNRIIRLELEDENGKFSGFANPNGTLYFED